MISNQILQNTIDGLKAITRTDLCVIDVTADGLKVIEKVDGLSFRSFFCVTVEGFATRFFGFSGVVAGSEGG